MKTIIYLAIGVIIIAGLVMLYQGDMLPGQDNTVDDSQQAEMAQEGDNNESMPVEPDGGIGDGAEPLAELQAAAKADVELAQSLDFKGLSEAEAQALAEENGLVFRVVIRDGEGLPVTMDHRPGRINASVEGNTVVEYVVEGAGEM